MDPMTAQSTQQWFNGPNNSLIDPMQDQSIQCELNQPNNSLINPMQAQSTYARIVLDVLPSQASSVPCEQLFSGTKQVATDCQASLGPIVFEEVTITKSAW